MSRPKNTDLRKRQIAEGLMKTMAANGYGGASVGAIARAAGLTPGLVHYHFRNKREILLALIDDLSRKVSERFESRAADLSDPWRRLEAFIDAHLALGEDADPTAVACWVGIGAEALWEAEVGEAYRKAVQQQFAELQSLIEAILRSENRPLDTAPQIAAGLLSAIQGAYQLAMTTSLLPEGFAAETVKAMMRGLLVGTERKMQE